MVDSQYERQFDEQFNDNKRAFEAQVMCISNVESDLKEKSIKLDEFNQFIDEPDQNY
jgi:hypothetical protein